MRWPRCIVVPDEYLRLARRWIWLIGLFVIVGAATATFALAPFVGSGGSSFDSSSTLAVSPYITASSITTTRGATTSGVTGTTTADDTVRADYAPVLSTLRPVDAGALAAHAETPQYIAALRRKLEKRAIFLGDGAIRDMLKITANPSLFRIELHAEGGSERVTDALVTTGAQVLMDRASAEEERSTQQFIDDLEQARQTLAGRLVVLQGSREKLLQDALATKELSALVSPETLSLAADLPLLRGSSPELDRQMRDLITAVVRLVGEPNLILADLEMEAAQKQLGGIDAALQGLNVNLRHSAPVLLLVPTETVEMEGSPVGKRDLLLLGGVTGLLVGWVGVNLAEWIRPAGGIRATGKNRANLH